MSQLRRYTTSLITLSLFAAAVMPAAAQVNIEWTGGVGDWNNPNNWESGFVPDGGFDEIAVIANGGTAFVTNSPTQPAGVVLNDGSLEIRSGGDLTVSPGAFAGEGSVRVGGVGQSALGQLTVMRGGSLTAEALSASGSDDSSIVLGELGGAGTANVTVIGRANLARNTRVVGPNVNFTAGSLTLKGTFTSEITGTNHSILSVDDSASLGGVLDIQFNGYTPSGGDAWPLIDAATIDGKFDAITSNISPGAGRAFVVAPTPGGNNGTLLTLSIQQILSLRVDRGTGAVVMENLEGGDPVQMDGYAIRSPSGSLSADAWNSLEDRGIGDFRASGSVEVLFELNPLGALTIDGGTTFDLGNVYAPPEPTEFGQSVDDLSFEYVGPSGALIQGQIEYTGPANNLVLRIDPDSGEGVLVNESAFSIEIDGYSISSESGALEPETWNSLEEQGVGDWRALPTSDANRLTELNPLGVATLTTGVALDLGTVFDPAGERDVMLEFALFGEASARQGEVVYRPHVDVDFTADFDKDGDVDGDDFLIWQANFGTQAGATPNTGDANDDGVVNGDDFLLWQAQFGSSTLAPAAAAVPEPTTAALVALLCFALATRVQHRTR